jgi:hypothetical protein
MTEQLDRAWWADYARDLAARFRQQTVIVRALEFESLSGSQNASEPPDTI